MLGRGHTCHAEESIKKEKEMAVKEASLETRRCHGTRFKGTYIAVGSPKQLTETKGTVLGSVFH